jgi:hypothetical protein
MGCGWVHAQCLTMSAWLLQSETSMDQLSMFGRGAKQRASVSGRRESLKKRGGSGRGAGSGRASVSQKNQGGDQPITSLASKSKTGARITI